MRSDARIEDRMSDLIVYFKYFECCQMNDMNVLFRYSTLSIVVVSNDEI